MIVSCPSCSTRFVVDPAALGAGGRRVRCVRCGHVWHQAPEPGSVSADLTSPDELEPKPLPPGSNLPAVRDLRSRRADRGWVLFGAVVVLLVATVLLGRDSIVRAWPPADRLYRTIGMTASVAGRGLDITDVSPEARMEQGERTVVVTGRVVNVADGAREVPPVEVALVDERGSVLSSSSTDVGVTSLRGGESVAFAVEFSRPSADAVRVSVGFEGSIVR